MKKIVLLAALCCFFHSHLWAATLYVTNRDSGNLSILREYSQKIDQLIPIGEQPWGVAVTPDSRFGCVSYVGGVALLDLRAKRVERHVAFEGQGMGVAIAPDGSYCYVAVVGGGSWVYAIQRSSGKIENEVSIDGQAFGIYISPDGQTLYVPEHTSVLSVIATPSMEPIQRIPLRPFGENRYARAHYLAMSPDGNTLYLPFEGEALVVIDTRTFDIAVHPMSIHAHQHGIALSPDGTRLYVANNVLGGEGSLSEIDAKTLKELRRFPLPRHHEQVLVDSEGRHVYLSGGFVMGYNAHDDLTVVNLEEGKVLRIDTKGLSPFYIFRAP